jgi:hypothetical protein
MAAIWEDAPLELSDFGGRAPGGICMWFDVSRLGRAKGRGGGVRREPWHFYNKKDDFGMQLECGAYVTNLALTHPYMLLFLGGLGLVFLS